MKKLLPFTLIFTVFMMLTSLRCKSQCNAVPAPYFENFSGFTANDQLPACWAASDLGNACKTYINNGGFGAFFSGPSGPNFFYSRALTLHTGVTYSVSIWKRSSVANSSNWQMALLLSNSQTSTAITPITLPSAVTSTFYTSTGNTFNVSTSGTYYIAIGANSMGSNTGEYLYFDDLSVIAPCPYPGNSPTVTISSSSPTLCAGQVFPTLTATGADTYTWSDGTQGPTFTVSPQVPTYYQVTGTNTLSGCNAMASFTLNVNPSPVMIAIASKPEVCSGETVTLNSSGAPSVSWSTGATTPTIVVSPSVNTTYTVTGTNQYGCSSSAHVYMIVTPSPTITINPSSSTVCTGGQAVITAGGSVGSYTWSNASLQSGNSLTINPTSNSNFTVSGSNQQGCLSSSVGNLIVSECIGIEEKMAGLSLSLFPNPCTDHLFIPGINSGQSIIIFDLTGREILTTEITGSNSINVSSLARGLYTIKAQGKLMKFIKE
jgi:hypothetical protein